MKTSPDEFAALVKNLAEAEMKLQELEFEIEEIGQPAAHELQKRLDHLKIEERALRRNLSEVIGKGQTDEARMARIEALMAYIKNEESSLENDTRFLHQSPPTSAEFAAQTGKVVLELCAKALKRIIGDHHPLGMSVFVNHSPQELVERFGFDESTGGR